jgi:PAS domain S-box-containing protein
VQRILGYLPGEIEGVNGFDMTHPDDRSALSELFGRIIETPGAKASAVYRCRHQDGSWRTFEGFVTNLIDDPDVAGVVVNSHDITERMEMEKALRDSEETAVRAKEDCERTFDSIPDLIAIIDNDFRVVRANNAMAERLGCAPHDCKTLKCFHVVHGTSEPIPSCPVARLLKDGKPHQAEIREPRLGGDFIVTASPLCGANGTATRCVHVARDITERKRLELSLGETNAFLDSIVENIPIMVFVKEAKGLTYTRLNRAAEEYLGYRRVEIIGKTDYDLFPREQADLLTERDREVLLGESLVDMVEEIVEARNRGKRLLCTRKVPILDAKGEPAYLLAISEDITARKRAEAVLLESEERYRKLAETGQDLMCIHDLEGRLLSVNPLAARILGYEPTELLGKNFRDILAPEARERFAEYQTALRRDDVAKGLMTVQTRTGRKRVWEYTNTLHTEGVTAPIVRAMARDVTKRLQTEAELCQLNEELERRVQRPAAFLSWAGAMAAVR